MTALGIVALLAALPADGTQGTRPVQLAGGDHDVERPSEPVDPPFRSHPTSTTTTPPPSDLTVTPAAVADPNQGSSSNSPVVDALAASGIPEVALRAYLAAQQTMATKDPSCNLRWSIVAALGRVESNHGRFRGTQLREDGTGTQVIRGIPLDGRPGVATIRDTDGGALDGDAIYDRAVGPMQFIPSSWRFAGADGNGDGRSDPDNIYDAALAAAGYLCAGDTDLANPADRSQAVFRYNHSHEYVQTVLSLADRYEGGPVDLPPSTPLPPTVMLPDLPSRELPPASPPDPPVDAPLPPPPPPSTSTSTSTTAPPTTPTTEPPTTSTTSTTSPCPPTTTTSTATTTTTLPGDPCPTTTTTTTTSATSTSTSTTSSSTSTSSSSLPGG